MPEINFPRILTNSVHEAGKENDNIVTLSRLEVDGNEFDQQTWEPHNSPLTYQDDLKERNLDLFHLQVRRSYNQIVKSHLYQI